MATVVIIGDPQQAKRVCRSLLEALDAPGLGFLPGQISGAESHRGVSTSLGDVVFCSVDSDDPDLVVNAAPAPAVPAARFVRRAIFRLEGEYWTVEHGGVVLRLRDSKGMRYIAYLLRYPTQMHRALDVVSAVCNGGGPARHDGSQPRASSHEPILDNQALAQYRGRLAEVRQELEDAETDRDLGRIGKLQHEAEWLERQLEQAFGLGRRRRCTPSTAERARQTLTKCVRSAIRRIERGNPELATHFDRRIKTGHLCGYEPGEDSHLDLQWEL
jgi:hypothetical protein